MPRYVLCLGYIHISTVLVISMICPLSWLYPWYVHCLGYIQDMSTVLVISMICPLSWLYPWYVHCLGYIHDMSTVLVISMICPLSWLYPYIYCLGYIHNMSTNPLLPGTSFLSNFDINRKIGSLFPATHRHESHRKFFRWSLLFQKRNFNNAGTDVLGRQ